MIRMWLVAAVAGTAAVQLLPRLPQQPGRWALLAAIAWAVLLLQRLGGRRGPGWIRAIRALLGIVLAGAAGFGYAAWRAAPLVADRLNPMHENLVTRLTVQVVGLATRVTGGQRFEVEVLQAPVQGIPRRLLVSWYAVHPAGAPTAASAAAAQGLSPGPVPENPATRLVRPGEIYRMALLLKQPHGLFNPHGFDYEAWLFERGVRATGTVRGQPQWVGDRPARTLSVGIQRVRHALRAAIEPHVEGSRYGAVILALAMGDQASVSPGDWEVFNRLGITHLVSISGSHVTFLAAGAAWLTLVGWKRARWRGVSWCEYVPAQVGAAAVALLVAGLYCLVAGWGVPARRTFFMLASVATAVMLRIPLSASRVLSVAAVLVTVLDPWAPLAPGFWLSFGAVAVLMLAGAGRWRAPARRRWVRILIDASILQAAITVALVPVMAFRFHEVSLASPLANAVAIPVVTFVITPLALVALLLAPAPAVGAFGGWLAWLAERAFAGMMVPIDLLARAEWAMLPMAAPPWQAVVLACAGVLWGLQPRGMPGRHAAWLLILPCVLHVPARPAAGMFRLTVLDVGQGSAAVIETARHTVVVDTGPPFGSSSDAGDRVVWPYLRARGITRVDDLIVSHADADHAGGLVSLLGQVEVVRLRASYRPERRHDGLAKRQNLPAFAPCRAGQGWVLDGVIFTVLHPQEVSSLPRDSNAHSCVIRVQGAGFSALLPGDIGVREEQRLVRQHGSALRSDVVLMAHHGSTTSSGVRFVAAVQARHAVAQAGYLSRFGHPRPQVVARWLQSGAEVHRTDLHGAITFEERDGHLQVRRQRDVGRRYWHTTTP